MEAPLRGRGGRLSARLYGLLLGAYPSAFRREYGREMRLVFADRCREREERGASLAGLWCAALADLARSAARERFGGRARGGGLMRTLRTVALAGLVYAFTLLVVAPLYASNARRLPAFVAYLCDALICAGVIFNFLYLLLTLPGWLRGVRAVRAAMGLTTALIFVLVALMVISVGPPAYVNLLIVVAQAVGLLFWFTAHLWWVLRRRPPAASAPD